MRAANSRTPHPIADIICAWANGFRVEFRYCHHNPGIPELVYLSDPIWHLCGKGYSAFSGVNEHRIHADDLAAWEDFKRNAYEAEKAQPAPEPTGWVTMWPVMGGGHKPCYSHGAKRPGYGPELDSLLTVYPVFAAGRADDQPADRVDAEPSDAQMLDWLAMQVVTVRTPLLYGSRAAFVASADHDDPSDTPTPSDIRTKVRAAMLAARAEKGGT